MKHCTSTTGRVELNVYIYFCTMYSEYSSIYILRGSILTGIVHYSSTSRRPFLSLISWSHLVAITTMITISKDFLLALLPLLPPCILLITLVGNPRTAVDVSPTFISQILAYMALAGLGFFLTNRLVPHIKVWWSDKVSCYTVTTSIN